ncbi:MAG: AraC family transcriptional regulator [Thermosynechococcaceae cyanobacterium MS004]|nr:AraC family transcriptional regulator [Thermosynechococcaceae cyanobacterium MS004]
MTITLTAKEQQTLWQEAQQTELSAVESNSFESLHLFPPSVGCGRVQVIEVSCGVYLELWNFTCCDNVRIKIPTSQHPVQFTALLSGQLETSLGPRLSAKHTLISGGGIQQFMTIEFQKTQPFIGVNIEMSPARLAAFFPGADEQLAPELSLLVKQNDWQTLASPKSDAAMQSIVQQILNCPYQGITKRMYLQAKVLELVTLQVDSLLTLTEVVPLNLTLKSKTVTQLYYAREILRSHLEHPPSLSELAQQVGVSDRTLRRGFQELFGTTVLGYVRNLRLKQAELLLREGNRTVCEVANLVGYSQLGHFAAAFRRKFGITPSDCLYGKKAV